MFTILSTLIGFLSSGLPSLFKYLNDKNDKAHELAIMQMQMEMAKLEFKEQLEEMNIKADVSERATLYTTYKTGITWIDAFNGTVRPVVTYLLVLLYITVKIMQYNGLHGDIPEFEKLEILWTQEDHALFAGVISFYFGMRHFNKNL
jgi:hypothetical protein